MYFSFIVKLDKDIEYSEMDDGTSFVIISKKKLDNVKHLGIIYEGVIDEIPRKDFRRLVISKPSMIIIIGYIIALIIIGILA